MKLFEVDSTYFFHSSGVCVCLYDDNRKAIKKNGIEEYYPFKLTHAHGTSFSLMNCAFSDYEHICLVSFHFNAIKKMSCIAIQSVYKTNIENKLMGVKRAQKNDKQIHNKMRDREKKNHHLYARCRNGKTMF